MSSSPPASAFRKARERLQTAQNAAFPGSLKIADMLVSQASVTLGMVTLELPGGGSREVRSLNATYDKVLLKAEPIPGAIVLHEGVEYLLNSFDGRESYLTSWNIYCVERERVAS